MAFEHQSKGCFIEVGSHAINVIEGGQKTSPRYMGTEGSSWCDIESPVSAARTRERSVGSARKDLIVNE